MSSNSCSYPPLLGPEECARITCSTLMCAYFLRRYIVFVGCVVIQFSGGETAGAGLETHYVTRKLRVQLPSLTRVVEKILIRL